MKYSTAKQGRAFVLRLEHGDIVHEAIETFASEQGIRAASLTAVGGADRGSILVTGPENGTASPVVPMHYTLDDVHEVSGTGTIFPDESGTPVLHMHMACGRKDASVTGCIRSGVKVWQIMEIILHELTDADAVRAHDDASGFKLLRI